MNVHREIPESKPGTAFPKPPAPETIAFPGIGLPRSWNSMEAAAGFLH